MNEAKTVEYETIAEKLKDQLGYKIGVVTSVNLNHATPAAFYAHQASRNDYYEIGEEMVESGFDYFAGGGLLKPDGDGTQKNLYTLAEENGYTVADTKAEAESVNAATGKTIIIDETLADSDAMSYDMDLEEGEWALKDYVKKGIEVLDNENGFFMMVEGGKIDWACHSNDAATAFKEVIDMDNAIKVAYEFYEQHPDETLIIITADHETGGIVLGTGKYELHTDLLKYQKQSAGAFSKMIAAQHQKEGKKFTWDFVRKQLQDNFGFWSQIPLDDRETEQLKKAYENFCEGVAKDTKTLYESENIIASTARQLMARKAMVGWQSGGHSNGYVPVFAIGAGAEEFTGRIDNTEIPKKIAEIAGYKE